MLVQVAVLRRYGNGHPALGQKTAAATAASRCGRSILALERGQFEIIGKGIARTLPGSALPDRVTASPITTHCSHAW